MCRFVLSGGCLEFYSCLVWVCVGMCGWDCEWVVLLWGGWFVLIGLNFLVWGLYCRLGGFL